MTPPQRMRPAQVPRISEAVRSAARHRLMHLESAGLPRPAYDIKAMIVAAIDSTKDLIVDGNITDTRAFIDRLVSTFQPYETHQRTN